MLLSREHSCLSRTAPFTSFTPTTGTSVSGVRGEFAGLGLSLNAPAATPPGGDARHAPFCIARHTDVRVVVTDLATRPSPVVVRARGAEVLPEVQVQAAEVVVGVLERGVVDVHWGIHHRLGSEEGARPRSAMVIHVAAAAGEIRGTGKAVVVTRRHVDKVDVLWRLESLALLEGCELVANVSALQQRWGDGHDCDVFSICGMSMNRQGLWTR